MQFQEAQAAIRESGLDGWLLYDFQFSNPVAYQVLGLTRAISKRRWFYWIPSTGTPVKIVSSVEPDALDSLPGTKLLYRTWRDLKSALVDVLRPISRVAMEYSSNCDIPIHRGSMPVQSSWFVHSVQRYSAHKH